MSDLLHNGQGLYFDNNGKRLVHVAGVGTEEVQGKNIIETATISAGVGSSNQSLVTFTVKDGGGTAAAAPYIMDVFLSDVSSGAGLTTVTASGAVAAGASGADFATLTSKKALRVQTTAAGVYILAITDTAKTGFYPCANINGQIVVGSQLTTASYG